MSIIDRPRQNKWINVSDEHPCQICNKPDWCRVSNDGRVVICRRKNNGNGKEKQDKIGGSYWVYRLESSRSASPTDSRDSLGFCKQEQASIPCAEPETLHRVYTCLLNELSLTNEHRGALERRALHADGIAMRQYRSLGRGRAAVVQRLCDVGLAEFLPQVPGFVHKTDGDKNVYWTIAGKRGLVIPIRDIDHNVVALQIRVDEPEGGGKYRYLSSKKYGGPGSGSPVHVPLFDGDSSIVRVTEGALKADVATQLSKVLTIGLPGVAGWRKAAPILKSLKATTAVLAFDTDAEANHVVASCLAHLARDLKDQGFSVELERWAAGDGKGIDDLLATGKQPQRIIGDCVGNAIMDIVALATKADCESGQPAEPDRAVNDPHRLARRFHRNVIDLSLTSAANVVAPDATSEPFLRYWREEWYCWDGAAYHGVPADEVQCLLCSFIRDDLDRAYAEQMEAYTAAKARGDSSARKPTPLQVTTTLVNNTMNALRAMVLLRATVEPPTWIGQELPFPAKETLVARNGLVHLPSLVLEQANPLGG
jgi:hypothetical protein